MSRRIREDIMHVIVWLAFSGAAWFALHQVEMDVVWMWRLFIAINIGTFLLYGLDKLFAVADIRRVSERVLYSTAFLFGSPGALAGMIAFRHKTSKISFQFILMLVIVVQILIVLAIIRGV